MSGEVWRGRIGRDLVGYNQQYEAYRHERAKKKEDRSNSFVHVRSKQFRFRLNNDYPHCGSGSGLFSVAGSVSFSGTGAGGVLPREPATSEKAATPMTTTIRTIPTFRAISPSLYRPQPDSRACGYQLPNIDVLRRFRGFKVKE
jgi:hypothetical protein